jgi:hypothetical protein
MVQLTQVASKVKSRLETVISKLKSQEDDESVSTSSESPKNANPEKLNHQTARVVDALFKRLLGACYGTSCTSKDDSHVISVSMCKKSILTRMRREELHKMEKSGDNLESHYAQHYQDDHGEVARAILIASEREEREKMSRKKQWQMMSQKARAEAMAAAAETNLRNKVERVSVNGKSLKLKEVVNSYEDESESGVSINFDDGISALSAHTLEEMAKAEKILQRQKRLLTEPTEQGFDLSLDKINPSGPPSPASTEESEAFEYDDNEYKQSEKDFESPRQAKNYPLQMARNNSVTESQVSSSIQTSESEFSHTWKAHEQNSFSQVVQKDEKPHKVKNSILVFSELFILSPCSTCNNTSHFHFIHR